MITIYKENKNGPEEKYLSDKDVIDFTQFCRSSPNLIVAPCGCGKTTFALNCVPEKLSSSPSRVLYLTDGLMSQDALLYHNRKLTQPYTPDLLRLAFIPSSLISTCYTKIIIMNHAELGAKLVQDPLFLKKLNIEVIIVDEMQESFWKIENAAKKLKKALPLMADEPCSDVVNNYEPNGKMIQTLVNICKENTTYVIILSATPNKIIKNFPMPLNRITVNGPLKQYRTHETIRFNSIEYVFEQMIPGKKYILYTSRITDIQRLSKQLTDMGFRVGSIWSTKQSGDKKLSPEQNELRDFITKNQKLPNNIDVFIFNDSCITGINIFGTVDTVIVNDTSKDKKTQARGRYRGDVPTLYWKTSKVEIPLEFLDIPLDKEQKQNLSSALQLKNPSNGRPLAWPSIKKFAEKNRYIVEKVRINNKSCHIIKIKAVKRAA